MKIQNQIARNVQKFGSGFKDAADNFVTQAGTEIAKTSANISVDAIPDSVIGSVREKIGPTVTNLANNVFQGKGPTIGDIGGILSGGIQNALGGLLTGEAYGAGGKLPNALDNYASYNYVFTLGCLTDFELNFPDYTYRVNEPFITIARSGGGNIRGSRTAYEKSGKVEYFIEDVEIETIIAPNPNTRQTNALSLRLKVIEPYSMGLFLQALQVAAIRAGHKSYIEAPFLLTCEFKGYTDGGRPFHARNLRRIFPLKLVNIEFDTNEGGSSYDIEALPFHELALIDEVQTAPVDLSPAGATVAEILQTGAKSLTSILNKREIEQVEAKQKAVADQYVISFPIHENSKDELNAMGAKPEQNKAATSTTDYRKVESERLEELYKSLGAAGNSKIPADFEEQIKELKGQIVKGSNLGETIRDYVEKTENMNTIGQSKLTKTDLETKTMPNGTYANCEDEDTPGKIDRCKVQRTGDVRSSRYTAGTKIQKMIEETIIASEYGRAVVDAKPDQNGMVDWFRIETQVYNISDPSNVDKIGRPARIYVYRVVPFKVHRSRFQSATAASQGIDNLKQQAVKEYNYIYTGLNKDIINFDIRFEHAFFTSLAGDLGQLSKDSVDGAQGQVTGGDKKAITGKEEGNTNDVDARKNDTKPNTQTGTEGHGIFLHPENQVARDFNEALVNSPVDLIMVNMEIWGDPYYIADSGMGNYNALKTPGVLNINADGTMEYQNGEVDIELNFRTPLDYRGNYMEFPGMGTQPVGRFSGLYQVLFVINKFSGGTFTQELELIRRPKQPTDVSYSATSEGGALVNTDNPEAQMAETNTNQKEESYETEAYGTPDAKAKPQKYPRKHDGQGNIGGL